MDYITATWKYFHVAVIVIHPLLWRGSGYETTTKPGTLMMVCLQVNDLQSYVYCILSKNWNLIWDFSSICLSVKFSVPRQPFISTYCEVIYFAYLEIRGVPIDDYLHCSHFIVEKCFKAKILLSALVEVAAADLHVAASLLCICGSYCKLVHLARTTHPSLSFESLQFFDEEVRRCFSTCIAADIPDDHWQQAQLSLSFGGLGFCSLSHHSYAEFISSLCSSAPNASSWLSVVPSVGQGLHLDPAEFQIPVVWWLVSCDMVVMWLSDTIAFETSSQSSVSVLTCLYEWSRELWDRGKEAQNTFTRLSSILSISQHCPKAKVSEIWVIIYLSMASAAAVAVTPTSNKVCGLSGDVIDTSKAAVLPMTQLGISISAGRVFAVAGGISSTVITLQGEDSSHANRLARWALMLSQYQYTIEYWKASDHGNADVLSHLPSVSLQLNPTVPRILAIKSEKNPVIVNVMCYSQKDGCTNEDITAEGSIEAFQKLAISLSTAAHGCLRYGSRVVIPTSVRPQVLHLLHLGHFRMQRIKQLAQTEVYWLGIDADIMGLCSIRTSHPNLKVFINAYSKYPCINPTISTSTRSTTEQLEQEFTHFGYPHTLVSDNAMLFSSEEFPSWCHERGISHLTGAPYHPPPMVLPNVCSRHSSRHSPHPRFLLVQPSRNSLNAVSPDTQDIGLLTNELLKAAQGKQTREATKSQAQEAPNRVVPIYSVGKPCYALYCGPRCEMGTCSGCQGVRLLQCQCFHEVVLRGRAAPTIGRSRECRPSTFHPAAEEMNAPAKPMLTNTATLLSLLAVTTVGTTQGDPSEDNTNKFTRLEKISSLNDQWRISRLVIGS
eukprot:Em0015g575a